MGPVLLLIWGSILCGVAAAYIGSKKGETIPGFVASALLGPLGIVLAYVSRGEDPKPHAGSVRQTCAQSGGVLSVSFAVFNGVQRWSHTYRANDHSPANRYAGST